MTTKFYKYILILFCVQLSVSQNIKIDTTEVNYRLELEKHYIQKSKSTLDLVYQMDDSKMKSEFLEIISERKKNFISDIKKGKFIYHDVFSPLISTILAQVKQANPQYNFEDIKILLALDDDINAYNFGEGIIVINLPLLLAVNNEMELSYIICHEISHQKLDHVFVSIQDVLKKSNSKEMLEKTNQIKKIKYNRNATIKEEIKKFAYSSSRFSRAKEHEADSLGFILYRKAYPKHILQSIHSLQSLKTIDKEKDSLTRQDYFKIFENSKVNFEESWLNSEDFSTYNYQKKSKFWDIDSLRTHPDIDIRVEYLKEKFNITDTQIQEFNNAKYLSLTKENKYDNIFVLYHIKEYGKSLYQTMILLKNEKENPLLKKMMYDNLMKISEYKSNYKLNQCLETESPNFTESYNTFLGFIRNLRKTNFEQIVKNYEY